jgi:acyl dehydratase
MTFAIGVGLTAASANPRAFTYGYERVRFPKPVFIGDTIHTEVEITSAETDPKRPAHGRVVEACSVINQRGETVLYCEHILLVQKQPA